MKNVECLMIKEKSFMKTTMQNIMIISLLVLSSAMQAKAVDYKNTYKHSVVSYQTSDYGIEATAQTVSFRSTSMYSAQWSQAAQEPMLNADGSVNDEAYGVGQSQKPGMRRVGGNGQSGTPGQSGTQQPLGDGLLALLLMAGGYVIARVWRRKEV